MEIGGILLSFICGLLGTVVAWWQLAFFCSCLGTRNLATFVGTGSGQCNFGALGCEIFRQREEGKLTVLCEH